MIRWLSWGKDNFVLACDMVHFERGTKQRYRLGPIDEALVAQDWTASRVPPGFWRRICRRDWLVGDEPSYADFRMATFLPFNNVARLPVEGFGSLCRWLDRLDAIPAWHRPFEGLQAPELPEIAS